MSVHYRVNRTILSAHNPMEIGDTDLEALICGTAQNAVDAARVFVRDYSGSALPRSRVTRVSSGDRLRIIFRAWRKPDGTCMEERMEVRK